MAGYNPTSDVRRTLGMRGGNEGSVAGANHLQQSIDSLTRAVGQLTGAMGSAGGNGGGGAGGGNGQNGGRQNGGNWQTRGGNRLTTPFNVPNPPNNAPATRGNIIRGSGLVQAASNNTNVSPMSAFTGMNNMAANYGAAHYSNQQLWDTFAITSSRNYGSYQQNLQAAKSFTYAGNSGQDTQNALTMANNTAGYSDFTKGGKGGGYNYMAQSSNAAMAVPGTSAMTIQQMNQVRATPQGQMTAKMLGYASAVNSQGKTKGTYTQLNDILQRSGVNVSKLTKAQVDGIFNQNSGAIALNMKTLGYSSDDIQQYQQMAQQEVAGMAGGKNSLSDVTGALSTTPGDANKNQQGIRKLALANSNQSAVNSGKARSAMTQDREADQTKAFATGVEEATTALDKFSGAMNGFLKGSGLGNFIGHSSGRNSILKSVPGVGTMLSNMGVFGGLVGHLGAMPAKPGAKPATAPNNNGSSSPGAGANGTAAVNKAMSQLGVPYVYGSEQEGKGFDCSGLTQWAYGQIGVKLPRTVAQQAEATPKVDPAKAQIGDLLISENRGHVMMYMGNGQAVEAPHTGDKVKTIAANPLNAQEVHRVVDGAGMGNFVDTSSSTSTQNQSTQTTQNNYGGGGNTGSYAGASEADIISSRMSSPGFGMSVNKSTGSSQNGSQTSGTDMTSQAAVLSGSAAQNRALGLQMAAARGWKGDDLKDFGLIGDAESGWQVDISNGGHHGYLDKKHAYGIPQSLPGDKMASKGPDWKSNPATQIGWMLDYIQGRYGSPSKAYAARQSRHPNWYDTGTGAGGVLGDQMAQVHDGEIILNKKSSDLVRAALRTGVADVKPFPQANAPALDSGPATLNSTAMGSSRGAPQIIFQSGAITISVPNGNMSDAAARNAAKQFVGYIEKDNLIQALVTS